MSQVHRSMFRLYRDMYPRASGNIREDFSTIPIFFCHMGCPKKICFRRGIPFFGELEFPRSRASPDRCQQDLGHKGIFEKNSFQFLFSQRPSEFPGKIDFFIPFCITRVLSFNLFLLVVLSFLAPDILGDWSHDVNAAWIPVPKKNWIPWLKKKSSGNPCDKRKWGWC